MVPKAQGAAMTFILHPHPDSQSQGHLEMTKVMTLALLSPWLGEMHSAHPSSLAGRSWHRLGAYERNLGYIRRPGSHPFVWVYTYT